MNKRMKKSIKYDLIVPDIRTFYGIRSIHSQNKICERKSAKVCDIYVNFHESSRRSILGYISKRPFLGIFNLSVSRTGEVFRHRLIH